MDLNALTVADLMTAGRHGAAQAYRTGRPAGEMKASNRLKLSMSQNQLPTRRSSAESNPKLGLLQEQHRQRDDPAPLGVVDQAERPKAPERIPEASPGRLHPDARGEVLDRERLRVAVQTLSGQKGTGRGAGPPGPPGRRSE